MLRSGWRYKHHIQLSHLGEGGKCGWVVSGYRTRDVIRGKAGGLTAEGKASSRAKNRRVSMGGSEGKPPGWYVHV